METFDNFEEFAEDQPQLAQELLEKVEKGDWQNTRLTIMKTYLILQIIKFARAFMLIFLIVIYLILIIVVSPACTTTLIWIA